MSETWTLVILRAKGKRTRFTIRRESTGETVASFYKKTEALEMQADLSVAWRLPLCCIDREERLAA